MSHLVITADDESWRNGPALVAENRLLREELRAVHQELTAVAAERDRLSSLWMTLLTEHPLSAQEVRERAQRVRRQARRAVGRFRRREIGPGQLGRSLLRVSYVSTVGVLAEWSQRFRAERRDVTELKYAGDRRLQQVQQSDADTPEGTEAEEAYRLLRLWRAVLAEEADDAGQAIESAGQPRRDTVGETEQDAARQMALDRLERDLAARSGRLATALDLTTRLARRDGSYHHEHLDAHSRTRTLSGWLPRIPGPPTPVVPISEDRVLHLAPASAPRSTGTTGAHPAAPALRRARDEAAAGLEPHVLGPDYLPEGWSAAETRIAYHQLGAGVAYIKVRPDRAMLDHAWLAYRHAQRIRPSVLVVACSVEHTETALVARAVARKTCLPLVLEFEPTDRDMITTGAVDRRRHELAAWCLAQADGVLVEGPAVADRVREWGVPDERIHVGPSAVDLPDDGPHEVPDAGPRRSASTTSIRTLGHAVRPEETGEVLSCLVVAAALLRDRGFNVRLLLEDCAKHADRVRRLAAQHEVADRVELIESTGTGGVSELLERGVDVVVVPGTATAATRQDVADVVDCLAAVQPVIAAAHPELAELLGDSEDQTFRPVDPVTLANAVAATVADPEATTASTRAGRYWLAHERSIEAVGKRLRQAYAGLQPRAGTNGAVPTPEAMPTPEGV